MSPLIWILIVFIGLVGYSVWRMRAQGFSKATAKRWLLYVPIALVMLGVFGGSLFLAEQRNVEENLIVKWMELIVTAALVFGCAVKEFWALRKKWLFWGALGILLISHFAVLRRLDWEKGSFFLMPLIVGMPEMLLVFTLLGFLFRPDNLQSSSSTRR